MGHYYDCDFCGKERCSGRMTGSCMDGTKHPPSASKNPSMDDLRRLDDELNPWTDEPTEVGDYWLCWPSGTVTAVHFNPLVGASKVDAYNFMCNTWFWPVGDVRYRVRWIPTAPDFK